MPEKLSAQDIYDRLQADGPTGFPNTDTVYISGTYFNLHP